MSSSGIDKHTILTLIGLGLGLIVTLIVIIAALGFNEVSQLIISAATATATKTPTRQATATETSTPTNTATGAPTNTPTAVNTATPTATSTNTVTPTATPIPPTATPTPEPATPTPPVAPEAAPALAAIEAIAPETVTETLFISTEPITTLLGLTQTTTLTVSGVMTPAVIPTPTFTPAPRTVEVPLDIPDYRQAQDHFWFARPLAAPYSGWGSYYYPYGTNARGQYFWHFGIDIQGAHGAPVLAVGDGRVIQAGPDTTSETQLGPWPDFYGQAVVIEHDQHWQDLPVYTLYGHVSQTLVQVGQPVKTGQEIARVGQLGVAIGPHLHLEIRLGAGAYFDTRNPDLWLRPDPGYGVIAGRVVDYQNYFAPQQLITLHYVDDPKRFWRQTFTYPDNVVNSDDQYRETFTFADVPEGDYLLKTFFDGRQLTVPVTVREGATTFVLLRQTEPPLIPTPTPGPPPTGEQPPQAGN